MILQQHQPVGSYAKSSVAEPFYVCYIVSRKLKIPIVHDHKIISGTMVFIKCSLHNNQINLNNKTKTLSAAGFNICGFQLLKIAKYRV